MKKSNTMRTFLILAALGLASLAAWYFWGKDTVARHYSMIYIPKTTSTSNDFWNQLISGIESAASEYNVSIEIMAPDAEQNIDQQNEMIREAINKKPDALLVSPSSYTESTDVLKEASDKGICLVFVDSCVDREIQDLTFATNNITAGRKLGEYALSLLDENQKEPQIAVISQAEDTSTARDRVAGFRSGVAQYEDNIVDVVYCNSDYDISYAQTRELLEKYPDLNIIAGMNDPSTLGAARAVRDAGIEDQVIIVGIDSSMEAVSFMEQGVMQGLVLQKPFKMGYIAVRETVRYLNGNKVLKSIDSGCELVTMDNIYTSEIEKLIFPFSSPEVTVQTLS